MTRKCIPHDYYIKIAKYYNDDPARAQAWFHVMHPRLGMMRPIDALEKGQTKKVMELIDNTIAGKFY